MSQAKHTPAPWSHCQANDGKCKCGLIWGADGETNVAAVNSIHCDVEDHGWSPEQAEEVRLANIALIQSAPELLSVCEDALDAIRDAGDDSIYLKLVAKRLEIAIANARGQNAR